MLKTQKLGLLCLVILLVFPRLAISSPPEEPPTGPEPSGSALVIHSPQARCITQTYTPTHEKPEGRVSNEGICGFRALLAGADPLLPPMEAACLTPDAPRAEANCQVGRKVDGHRMLGCAISATGDEDVGFAVCLKVHATSTACEGCEYVSDTVCAFTKSDFAEPRDLLFEGISREELATLCAGSPESVVKCRCSFAVEEVTPLAP